MTQAAHWLLARRNNFAILKRKTAGFSRKKTTAARGKVLALLGLTSICAAQKSFLDQNIEVRLKYRPVLI
jgi:hypothetical protein